MSEMLSKAPFKRPRRLAAVTDMLVVAIEGVKEAAMRTNEVES
jgi:hypothetical protein